MAGWGDYIQLHLLATGHVSQAMIINKHDGTTWATTPEFHLRKYSAQVSVEGAGGATVMRDEPVNELVNLLKFVESGEENPQGLRINSEKYVVVSKLYDALTMDYHNKEDSVGLIMYCKKKTGGCCIAITQKAIIIGTYDSLVAAGGGHCNNSVQSLAKYLLENGF